MFDIILAAIDRSTANKRVFEEALSLAQATKAKLILLHVLSAEEPDSPILSRYPTVSRHHHYLHLDPELVRLADTMYHQQWKAFEAEGLKILRSFRDRAIAAGVTTEFSQITGHPSSTICDFASSCHAEVIVIGRRGFSQLKELLVGSVSNYVIHHAPCSVMLVPTAREPERNYGAETMVSTKIANKYLFNSRGKP
ncbi:universal stress protein [Myxosarcina sp. GI1]|uniref:universal stress protein n=1 Tax=Myxosarcina sp. GI1 TaxID=1541065 RepID=UPI00055C23EB|nr:universal stress protein [Myxosarcina sp. GI1]